MPDLSTDDIRDDIMEIIDRLRQVGLGKVIVYDLTRKELGVPVVRVIVPGWRYMPWTRTGWDAGSWRRPGNDHGGLSGHEPIP